MPLHGGVALGPLEEDLLYRADAVGRSDYVIDETLTLMRFRLGSRAAAAWWAQIDASSRIRWERIGASRAEKARMRFFDWNGSDGWIGKDLRALTTNRHFSQAGFETVPRVPDRSPRYSIGE